jgi:hypothetical protein
MALTDTPPSYLDNLRNNFDAWKEKADKAQKIKNPSYEPVSLNPPEKSLSDEPGYVDYKDFDESADPNYQPSTEQGIKRTEKLIDRHVNKSIKMKDKADSLRATNPDRANRIMDRSEKRLNRVSEKAEGLMDPEYASSLGSDVAAGGIAALGELPSIVNQFSDKPESAKEATGKSLSLTASGAKIGMAAAGPWGAAVGAVVGFGSGIIANSGWRKDLMEKNDKIAQVDLDNQKQDRMKQLFENSNSEQLQQEQKMLAQSLGYTRIS